VRVQSRFVPALPIFPLFSRVAPTRLSAVVPAKPAAVHTATILRSAIFNRNAVIPMANAAQIAATVPIIVTPPFVPRGTFFNVVIR